MSRKVSFKCYAQNKNKNIEDLLKNKQNVRQNFKKRTFKRRYRNKK